MSDKQRRGFAVMDRSVAQAIQAEGGRQANALGTAHKWTQASGQAAGRKGGLASAAARRIRAERAMESGDALPVLKQVLS